MRDPYQPSGASVPTFLFSGETVDPEKHPYCELFVIYDTPALTGKQLTDDIKEAGDVLSVTLSPGADEDVGFITYTRKSGGNASGKRTDSSGRAFIENLNPMSARDARQTAIPRPSQLPSIESK